MAACSSHRTDPAAEYGRRLADRRRELARQDRLEKTVSLSRLVVMVALLVTAWLAVQSGLFAAAWTLLPLLLFLGLVGLHRRLLTRAARARRAAEYYEAGVARIEDRWAGTGPHGESYLPQGHPYAADLDLFGDGSLFQLLCTARTRPGQDKLAAWLLQGAGVEEVLARQDAVEDLRRRLDLREELWRLGESAAERLHHHDLAAWGTRHQSRPSRLLRSALAALAALQVLAAAAWALLDRGPTLLLALLLVQTLLLLFMRPRIRRSLEGLQGAGRELDLLARFLGRIESEAFSSVRLSDLRAELAEERLSPSRQLSRLRRLVEFLESRKNPLFFPLDLLLVWTPQLALAAEAWGSDSGAQVSRWIDVAAEIEALAALSGYAYEHPDDPFPQLLAPGSDAVFEGVGLGHPLVPAQTFVRNDVELGPGRRVLIVSGSNMSGKSTYLRTTGVNTVLALAGAPVRARRLRLSPLSIGASLRIHDSLQQGQSRFYAEILRLRQILDAARTGHPTLFLLDEILHGTNSHDRRIGAEAVVRSLLRWRTIGLVTTHDLALARIADDPSSEAVNVHFEDEIAAGRIAFDYRLRPGVVSKSNALALMREVGLEL